MFVLVRFIRSIHQSLYRQQTRSPLGFPLQNSRSMNCSHESFGSRTVQSSNSNLDKNFFNSTDSSIPWISQWPSIEEPPASDLGDPPTIPSYEAQIHENRGESSAIQRIVLRLQNLTMDNEYEENDFHPSGEHDSFTKDDGFEDLLQRNWVRPDKIYYPNQNEVAILNQGGNSSIHSRDRRKKKKVVPLLAELALGKEELIRLMRLGKTVTDIITVPKAGLTHDVMEKIYDRWKNEELVKLKFHDDLTNRMKMAKRLVESRTGGWVVRLSGAFMVVFRGRKFEEISIENVDSGTNSSPILSIPSNSLTPLDVNMSRSREKSEHDRILDGLGPRFTEWWGTGVLPVDGDLLPSTIPDYKPPFRVLPIGKRSSLSDKELQNLRKLSKTMPSHFALGRNRYHHGLAAAMVKLWERSFVAKIAVKQGVQNTNNKLMAEELRDLTGGTLLLRNKYYIIMYRGKDFVPAAVASSLLKKTLEIEEGKSTTSLRIKPKRKLGRERLPAGEEKDGTSLTVCSSHGRSSMKAEELSMFKRVGMVMKVYFHIKKIRDVVMASKNMHVCWKYREVVKLMTRKHGYSYVEEMGRILEQLSGGILVAIEPYPKGYALIYYRGKNYRRPKSNRFNSRMRRSRLC